MIVCVCRRVSHHDIEREVRKGCASFDQLQDELGVADACGACADCARAIFEQACEKQASAIHLVAVPITSGAATFARATA